MGLGSQSEPDIWALGANQSQAYDRDPSSAGIKGELSRNQYFQPGAQVMLMQMPMLGKRSTTPYFTGENPGPRKGRFKL